MPAPKTSISPFGNIPRRISRLPAEIPNKDIHYCRRCDTYFYPKLYYGYGRFSVCLNCGCIGFASRSFYPWKEFPEIDKENVKIHEFTWEDEKSYSLRTAKCFTNKEVDAELAKKG